MAHDLVDIPAKADHVTLGLCLLREIDGIIQVHRFIFGIVNQHHEGQHQDYETDHETDYVIPDEPKDGPGE
jgi:hypothetical protein